MPTKWNEMSQPEKIEQLHRDLLELTESVGVCVQNQELLGQSDLELMQKHQATSRLVTKFASAVLDLEQRVRAIAER